MFIRRENNNKMKIQNKLLAPFSMRGGEREKEVFA